MCVDIALLQQIAEEINIKIFNLQNDVKKFAIHGTPKKLLTKN